MIPFMLFCRIESLIIIESTDTFSTIYDFLRSNLKFFLVGVDLFPIFDNL
ncbi:hypothetical protein BCAH1134_C0005 (plasmid) [Bacillus cereus AH1134]|nr:hypothetical protein BCAH1134_C0005 [Bacillus cereus AH1134]